MNFKEIEKRNIQICSDVKALNEGAESVTFRSDMGVFKALLISDKNQVPSIALSPVVQNRTEYDVYKVKTPKEAETNEKFFFYAVKNNTLINERFEVVRWDYGIRIL